MRLDLLAPRVPDEDGAIYRFKFLDDNQAARDGGKHWFRVADIFSMEGGPAMLTALMERGLEGDALKSGFGMLDRLYRVVHTDPLIHYYEETGQDLERVLNIFIRLNSGGTVLSYSDLLLSVAVAQWKQVERPFDAGRGTGLHAPKLPLDRGVFTPISWTNAVLKFSIQWAAPNPASA